MGADPTIVKAVQRLGDRVRGRYPLTKVILFGSHARGDARPDSDVDLLLVSPAFEGKRLSERAPELHLAWDLMVPVDMLCYAPSEFERLRQRVSIVTVALEEGIDITPAS